MSNVAKHSKAHKTHHASHAGKAHNGPTAEALAKTLIKKNDLTLAEVKKLQAMLKAEGTGSSSSSSAGWAPKSASTSAGKGGTDFGPLYDQLKKPSMPADPKDDKAMMKYQEDMQAYNRMVTMLTNMIQMQHESLKAVIQNFRG
jgi:hypothetical protein